MGQGSGHTFALNIDVTDEDLCSRIVLLVEEMLGETPFHRVGMALKVVLLWLEKVLITDESYEDTEYSALLRVLSNRDDPNFATAQSRETEFESNSIPDTQRPEWVTAVPADVSDDGAWDISERSSTWASKSNIPFRDSVTQFVSAPFDADDRSVSDSSRDFDVLSEHLSDRYNAEHILYAPRRMQEARSFGEVPQVVFIRSEECRRVIDTAVCEAPYDRVNDCFGIVVGIGNHHPDPIWMLDFIYVHVDIRPARALRPFEPADAFRKHQEIEFVLNGVRSLAQSVGDRRRQLVGELEASRRGQQCQEALALGCTRHSGQHGAKVFEQAFGRLRFSLVGFWIHRRYCTAFQLNERKA